LCQPNLRLVKMHRIAPNWQLPDIDLPDLSEIPICNSLYPAAGLGMVGIVAMKKRKKSTAADEEEIDHP
jgi:hypothetical protein